MPGEGADADDDGIPDAWDPCPFDAENDIDQDGACGDVDVCPDNFDPDQTNTDGDEWGDECDACPFQSIHVCDDEDGECPCTCDRFTDADCSNTCGNNILEGTENCDGTGTHPTACPRGFAGCDDEDPCTLDWLIEGGADPDEYETPERACYERCQNLFIPQLCVSNVDPAVNVNTGLLVTEGGGDTFGTLSLEVTDPDTGDTSTIEYQLIITPPSGTLYLDMVPLRDGDTFTQAEVDAGDLTYAHNGGERPLDWFHVVIMDGEGGAVMPTPVLFHITPVNDAPEAEYDLVSVLQNTTEPIELMAYDADDPEETLDFTVISGPSHGSLSGTPPNLDYTPDTDYLGMDSFDFSVSDGELSDTNTIGLYISTGNRAPYADDLYEMVTENEFVEIELTGSDDDFDELTFSVVDSPINGVLSGSPPNVTYTPDPDYVGEDSFTFTANDGLVDSAPGEVEIEVVMGNQAPVAQSASYTTDEDEEIDFEIIVSDYEDDPLDLYPVVPPLHGRLDGDPPFLTYVPDRDFHGVDSFSFMANDGFQNSNIATITFTIESVNDAPMPWYGLILARPNQTETFRLHAWDPDHTDEELTYSMLIGPTNGSITGTLPNVEYTPNTDFSGNDYLVFSVSDGEFTNSGVVQLFVSDENWKPMARDDAYSVAINSSVAITLDGFDPNEEDTLTYSVIEDPENGTLTGTAPNLVYTPDTDYSGSDSFDFIANDGEDDSEEATVWLVVNASGNSDPVAIPQSVFVFPNDPTEIILIGWDYDKDDILTFSITGAPSNGDLTLDDPLTGDATYTPDSNYFGPDSFTFTVDDGTTTDDVDVTIHVGMPNTPPLASDMSLSVNEDESVEFTLSASDEDGDPIYYFASWEQGGYLTGDVPTVTYYPEPNFSGEDQIEFEVTDLFRLGPYDGEHDEEHDDYDEKEDQFEFLYQPMYDLMFDRMCDPDIDPEDTPMYALIYGPSYVLGHRLMYDDMEGPMYDPMDAPMYDPMFNPIFDPMFDPMEEPWYDPGHHHHDGPGPGPGPDPDPWHHDDWDFIYGPIDYPVAGADYGPMYALIEGLMCAPNVEHAFGPLDTFFLSSFAYVDITVMPVNDAPVATASSVGVIENVAEAITMEAMDVDPTDILVYSITSAPTHGSTDIGDPNNGLVTYTPDTDYIGGDSFTFEVTDGTLTDTAVITITVGPPNDAPVANAQSVSLDEDTTLEITLTSSDTEDDPVTYEIIDYPMNGILTGVPPNLTYVPYWDRDHSDGFTFSVSDDFTESTPATIWITINPINDGPEAEYEWMSVKSEVGSEVPLQAHDIDDVREDLIFTVLTPPDNGTLSGVAPDLTYTSDEDYFGSDFIVFSVTDGEYTDHGLVEIFVSDNNPPVVDDQTLSVDSGESLEITLTASDLDDDELGIYIVEWPHHGTLDGFGEELSYHSQYGYTGTDTFRFRAHDWLSESLDGVVTIEVQPLTGGDPPSAQDMFVNVRPDEATDIVLNGFDMDTPFEFLGWGIAIDPSHGTLTGVAPNLTYTPDEGYLGNDYFVFSVDDGESEDLGLITIVVEDGNQSPSAHNQWVSAVTNTPLPITLTGDDFDDDSLTFEIVDDPEHGVLTGTAPNVVYTPDTDYNGDDTFTFETNDGVDPSHHYGTVYITVSADGNSAPVANPRSVSTDADTSIQINLNAFDRDDDSLTFSVTVPPTDGTTGPVDPFTDSVQYTPDFGFGGRDVFTFSASDGLLSDTAEIEIHVGMTNSTPEADDQSISVTEDTPTPITLTGSDMDGDNLWFSAVGHTHSGTLSGEAPNLVYTPDPDFDGSDNFTFQANDHYGAWDDGTIDITITPVNDAPVAYDYSIGCGSEHQHPTQSELARPGLWRRPHLFGDRGA